jgi:hypothetical protein
LSLVGSLFGTRRTPFDFQGQQKIACKLLK